MMSPSREYARRVSAMRDAPWWRALLVPVLLTALLGIVTSAASTGRVVAPLVLSQSICWSFVPALQLATGSLLIASARHRRVTFARGVELLFAGHGPWSVWLAAVGMLQMLTPSATIVLASSLAPWIWTAWILRAFAGEALGLGRSQALVRVLAHQAATLLLVLPYLELATRLSVRLIGVLQ